MQAVQAEMKKLALAMAAPADIATHFYDNYGVVAQQHMSGRLWLFDYDQLASHKHRMTQVVMESRGLVMCAQSLELVRRPFARFFNIGEAPAYEADIDYARLEALEKADGSLVTLYFNKVSAHWQLGTRGTPFAEGRHRNGGVFHSRVTQALGIDVAPGTDAFDELMSHLDPQVTYLFEFIGPDNAHVTPYATSELVVLGARYLTGAEFSPVEVTQLHEQLLGLNWRVRMPRRYPIPLALAGMARPLQIEAIKTWVATAPDFKKLHEGVVCYDPLTGKRLKVKTPLYCAVHLQGDEANGLTISPARVAEMIVSGDAEEFCLYFPLLAPIIHGASQKVHAFIESLSPIWEQVKAIDDQKAFALEVQLKAPGAAASIFFNARKTGMTPAQSWLSMPLNKKTSLAEKLVS